MTEPQPKTVGAADLKQHCLKILDELPREGLIITKRGKPVAHLLPVPRSTVELIGLLKGKLKVHGDIIDTSDLADEYSWTADEDNSNKRSATRTPRKRRRR